MRSLTNASNLPANAVADVEKGRNIVDPRRPLHVCRARVVPNQVRHLFRTVCLPSTFDAMAGHGAWSKLTGASHRTDEILTGWEGAGNVLWDFIGRLTAAGDLPDLREAFPQVARNVFSQPLKRNM